MNPNHQTDPIRHAEGNPRPIPRLYGACVLIVGALEAVRGEDGVWAVTLEETSDA